MHKLLWRVLLASIVLVGCGGGTELETEQDVAEHDAAPFAAQLAAARSPTRNIAIWGDSLTPGVQEQLRAMYPKRSVYNGGAAGQTSSEIRLRFEADTAHRDQVTIIWAGRNNYRAPDTVMEDVAAMVAGLGHDRFLVVSIINGDYASEHKHMSGLNTINSLNRALAMQYPGRFIQARSRLLKSFDPTSAQDLIDVADGIPPSSLRQDPIHLKPAGSMVVARLIQHRIRIMGW
jgi:hypothetical protein